MYFKFSYPEKTILPLGGLENNLLQISFRLQKNFSDLEYDTYNIIGNANMFSLY